MVMAVKQCLHFGGHTENRYQMKLVQNNVLGGNKLNCFKTMQVLRGLTQILIWGSEIAKGPTR